VKGAAVFQTGDRPGWTRVQVRKEMECVEKIRIGKKQGLPATVKAAVNPVFF
jgi:hypothetical protein